VVVVDDEGPSDLVPVLRGLSPGERVVSAGALLLSSME
jgi:hypothetical protein